MRSFWKVPLETELFCDPTSTLGVGTHRKLQKFGCWWSFTSSDFLQPRFLLSPDSPHGLGVYRGIRGTLGRIQLSWFPLLMADSYCPWLPPYRNQFQGNFQESCTETPATFFFFVTQPFLSWTGSNSSSRLRYPPLGAKHLWEVSKFYKLKKFFPTQALSPLPWKKRQSFSSKKWIELTKCFKKWVRRWFMYLKFWALTTYRYLRVLSLKEEH